MQLGCLLALHQDDPDGQDMTKCEWHCPGQNPRVFLWRKPTGEAPEDTYCLENNSKVLIRSATKGIRSNMKLLVSFSILSMMAEVKGQANDHELRGCSVRKAETRPRSCMSASIIHSDIHTCSQAPTFPYVSNVARDLLDIVRRGRREAGFPTTI